MKILLLLTVGWDIFIFVWLYVDIINLELHMRQNARKYPEYYILSTE